LCRLYDVNISAEVLRDDLLQLMPSRYSINSSLDSSAMGECFNFIVSLLHERTAVFEIPYAFGSFPVLLDKLVHAVGRRCQRLRLIDVYPYDEESIHCCHFKPTFWKAVSQFSCLQVLKLHLPCISDLDLQLFALHAANIV
jgi:hypothetical protein